MNRIVVPVQISALLGLVVSFFLVPDGASNAIIWSCLAVFYCYLWAAIVRPTFIIPSIPSYLNIRLLFLIFSYILYYLPYQMSVVGAFNLTDPGRFLGSFAEQTNRAVISATMGMVAFSLGLGRPSAPPGAPAPELRTKKGDYPGIDTVAPLSLVAAMTVYVAAGWRSSGEGRYVGTAAGGVLADGASLIIVMLAMICIANFIVELGSRRSPRLMHWVGLAASVLWAFAVLGSGDRNTFLLLALVGLAGYFSYISTAGRLTLGLALAVALIGYNIIEVIRLTGEVSLDSIVAYFSRPTLDDGGSSSFNTTTVTVRAALYAVPNMFDFFYGTFKLLGFAGIFPLVRGLLFGDSIEFSSTSNLLTYVMLGPNASWGVGTNVISDIYLDFGAVGIPAVMYLIGRYARAVQAYAVNYPRSRRATAIYLSSLALIAEIPRYAVDFPVRIIVWMALFFWLYGVLIGKGSGVAAGLSPGTVNRTSRARGRRR